MTYRWKHRSVHGIGGTGQEYFIVPDSFYEPYNCIIRHTATCELDNQRYKHHE